GEETEVYTRIVGYYRPVKNWNHGKKSEYNDRKTYACDTMETIEAMKRPAPVELEETDSPKEDETCEVASKA
ncbi:hypothetical protein DRN98_10020, partial [Methanosarcinales archaeon]